MDGIIDQIRVRIRTHDPFEVKEVALPSVKEAIDFLMKYL